MGRAMVDVLNKRANVHSHNEGEWTLKRQTKFDKLLDWVRNASPKDLADFTNKRPNVLAQTFLRDQVMTGC